VWTALADEAFVTLATSDDYALGALVLSSSLRRVDTSRQLVVMVTTGVSQAMRSDNCYLPNKPSNSVECLEPLKHQSVDHGVALTQKVTSSYGRKSAKK